MLYFIPYTIPKSNVIGNNSVYIPVKRNREKAYNVESGTTTFIKKSSLTKIMAIKIIITGGTIDDLEYESPEDAPKEHKSLVPHLLKQSKITLDYDVDELLQKDSRDVNNDDRELVYQKCMECSEKQIIITHGTMTMPDTAKYLGKKNIPKTIVLLGAAVPANKDKSDALFNLGTALSVVQLLPHGVYVTMNGKIFSWDNVKKNLDKGIFETEK